MHFLDWLGQKRDLIKVANMKLHHVYGEEDSEGKFSMRLVREISSGNKETKLTTGVQFRDFVYGRDVVNAYEIVMLNNHRFDSMQEFNVATGSKCTVRDFSLAIGYEILQSRKDVEDVLCFGARDGDPDEIMDADNNNRELLGLDWKPQFDLVSGVRKMIAGIQG
jgi:nucleoside-diphosphate-sugar epimerase